MSEATRVAFVCWGNICRSPMAERVFAKRAADAGLDVVTESFGVSSEEAGNPMDRRARRVLTAHGYDAERHTARRIAAADLARLDLVIAAEERHRDMLLAIDPDANVRLIREFDPDADSVDLDDPWYGPDSAFDVTLAQIETAIPGMLEAAREA